MNAATLTRHLLNFSITAKKNDINFDAKFLFHCQMQKDIYKRKNMFKEKMDEYLEKAEDERRERDIGISDGELPQDLKLLCDTVQASMKGDGKKVKKEISQLRKEVAQLRQILVMMTSTGVSGGRGGAGMKMERRNPSVAASEEQNSGRYSKRASK